MNVEFELGSALEKLIKSMNRSKTLIDGVITNVNSNYTCDITVLGVPISGVPINVLIGSQTDFYIVPKINTPCLVTFRDGDMQRPQIIQFHQADKVVFFQGLNGGMILINDMVQRMNNVENLLNDLIAKYNQHTHILTLTSGTGTAAPTTTIETQTATLTQVSDIENQQIIQ